MKISQNDIKTILWATIEDYCGLWEIPWELKANHQDMHSNELKKLAFNIISVLIKAKTIELFHCKEPYGQIDKIDNNSSYYDLLKTDKYWKVPDSEEMSIRLSATKKGEALYNSQTFDTLI
jgi:hypothetical protein